MRRSRIKLLHSLTCNVVLLNSVDSLTFQPSVLIAVELDVSLYCFICKGLHFVDALVKESIGPLLN